MKASLVLLAAAVNAFSASQWLNYFIPRPDSIVINSPHEPESVKEMFQSEIANFDKSTAEKLISVWEELASTKGMGAVKEAVAKYENFGKVLPTANGKKLTSSVFDNDFDVHTSSKHDGYSLRTKETNPEKLGLDTVKQYTGYLDVEEVKKHFFFWFFESRNDPKNDPVILWLNGGPGCSSSTGLFFELGPSFINATLQPVYNPYAWNSNASVIFLDQPVGVGYSYTDGDDVVTSAAAAKDVYVFLELFFQKFPQFASNQFHIAGESYAGHYIPAFASEIINNADRSFELTSVLIGNGITDSLVQNRYYRPMACGEGGYKPVLSTEECEAMDRALPTCEALTKVCYQAQNAFTCVPANIYCGNALVQPYQKTGLNPYDIRKDCASGDTCYVEMDYVEEYLNLEFVREAVGSKVDSFTGCDNSVFLNFILSGDESKPFQQYVKELLEKGVAVLLYEGDKDFICNWLGNHAWSDELQYTKHDFFEVQPLRPWHTSEGKLAGEVKNYGDFTFARVYDAGHMVPHDQPENSLDLVNRWIQGERSFA